MATRSENRNAAEAERVSREGRACEYVLRTLNNGDPRGLVSWGGTDAIVCRKRGAQAYDDTSYTNQPGTTTVMIPRPIVRWYCAEHATVEGLTLHKEIAR